MVNFVAEKDYGKFRVVCFADEKAKRKKFINNKRAAWKRFKKKNGMNCDIRYAKEA
jgi:hypothetical protein